MSPRICIVTGTRAEFGLLSGLMEKIKEAPDLVLQVVATGAHLSPSFGLTVEEIEATGFTVDARVEMLLASDTPVGVSKSLGLGVIGCADAFQQLRPDLVIVLGDRFEALAAATSAMMARIPIGHIHGGEATEGAVDEAIRHAITKMAYLHFVAADPFRRRVIQLGEEPSRVFDVGALAIDTIARKTPLPKAELEDWLGGFALSQPFFLVTYHPATLVAEESAKGVQALLSALDRFPTAQVLFTGVNADTGGYGIGAAIGRYVEANPGRVRMVASMGHRRYLSAMHYADVVVGNSSSGLIEAPAIGVPTVNIGSRQRGRPQASSVIAAQPEAASITEAIRAAMEPAHRTLAKRRVTPYGAPGAPERVLAIIRERLPIRSLDKAFVDQPCHGRPT